MVISLALVVIHLDFPPVHGLIYEITFEFLGKIFRHQTIATKNTNVLSELLGKFICVK